MTLICTFSLSTSDTKATCKWPSLGPLSSTWQWRPYGLLTCHLSAIVYITLVNLETPYTLHTCYQPQGYRRYKNSVWEWHGVIQLQLSGITWAELLYHFAVFPLGLMLYWFLQGSTSHKTMPTEMLRDTIRSKEEKMILFVLRGCGFKCQRWKVK